MEKEIIDQKRCLLICNNPIARPKDKLTAIKSIKESDMVYDIISGWRDSLSHLVGVNLENMVSLLLEITRWDFLDTHNKIMIAVQLYNNSIFSCYTPFDDIMNNEEVEIKFRLEAAKYMFSSETQNLVDKVNEFFQKFITNHAYPSKFRYTSFSAYFTNKGISTLSNFKKLRIPYNESFVCKFQKVFFNDDLNDLEYRLLSGQHLLQMSTENMNKTEKEKIMEIIFCECLKNNPSACDILMRLGSPEYKINARKIIVDIGNVKKENDITPVSFYENSQNVHNTSLELSISLFIDKLIENYTYDLVDEDNIKLNISKWVSETGKFDLDQKNTAMESLDRIYIDTAIFGSTHMTMKEILVHVYSRIVSDEFHYSTREILKTRMVEELIEMYGTCSWGYPSRLVNVLSFVDDSLRMGWFEQIQGNVKGRILASLRDNEDEDTRERVSLGLMKNADEGDKKIYINFITKIMDIIEKDLYKEFVDAKFVKMDEFILYMQSIRKEWGL